MSTSGLDNIQEHISADPKAGNGPEKKSPDSKVPFENASSKEGDPWTTLANAELEEDKVRCDAWKEEVQNLLIFAGLFSAVVTAFIIESYKLLQPDPNDAITGLLFHIANGLNNSYSLPPFVSSQFILTSFSQPPAAIRINVFWFISLIFSLATVLVGTIALQWLREYQSHVGYAPKEKVAILHMRKRAIEAWYLPQVFAALPLLLQVALTLFLAGLTDFSLLLGRKLTIPVCIAVGATLLFLAATTLLPLLQGLWLLFGIYPRKAPPTPCPYKSPQSHIFRILFGKVLCQIFLRTTSTFDFTVPNGSGEYRWISTDQYFLIPKHLASHVLTMWCQRSWLTFDREWLSLRDACHQRILDTDPGLADHRFCWEDDIPLSDVTQYFTEVTNQASGTKHTESFLNALVSCFREVSESIWTAKSVLSEQRKDRRNHYFEQLLHHGKDLASNSLPTFLLHGGAYQVDRFDNREAIKLNNYIRQKTIQRLFIDERMAVFLTGLLARHTSPAQAQSQIDLWCNVLNLSNKIAPLTPIRTKTIPFLSILGSVIICIRYWPKFGSSAQKYSAIANMLTTIFELAASHYDLQDPSMGSICASQGMAWAVDVLACETAEYLELELATADGPTEQHGELWDVQLPKLFNSISDNLKKEQSHLSSSSGNAPRSVLFYFSSCLIHHVSLRTRTSIRDDTFGQALRSAHEVFKSYYSATRNSEWRVSGLEFNILFSGDLYHEVERFSPDWWQKFFQDLQIDLQDTEHGPASAEEMSSDAHLGTLSRSNFPSENETVDAIKPLPGSCEHPDNPPANPHPNSPPEISECKLASNLVNHVNDSITHSLSDLPAILNHSATSNEDIKLVETPALIGDHTAAGATAEDPGSVVSPQQATGNGIRGRNNEHDCQLRRDHSAIDFELPTNLEQANAEIPGSAVDHSQSRNQCGTRHNRKI